MNNTQVAHLWANKSRERASGSHFFFEGDTIYSYGHHFPIARHYKGVVFFTTQGYSSTTAKHKGYVRDACSHLAVFHVSNVITAPSGKDVKEYGEQIKYEALQQARARKPAPEMLESAVNEANDFCNRFGFKTRFSMPDEKMLAELRERAKIASAKKAKATAERNTRIERENAELVSRWIAGEKISIPYNYGKVHLRARPYQFEEGKEPEMVMETTRGAHVPLKDAERAFRFVTLKRETGWHRNGEQCPIGEFQLDAVNENGVVAGCHRVSWDEIERFAKSQAWI